MGRVERNFEEREPSLRQWFINNTWCDHCAKADLGLTCPSEYEEDGQIYIEGLCRQCGNRVVSLIEETEMGS